MKRMHDDKFINELNATASEALENANNAQSDIDNLASVYTFAKLEISESDMGDINPYGTPEPVSLAIGDTIYENGEAVELTAAKLQELYAANLIVLSSGEDPTNHDTIAMQRQSADPLDDGADGSARFESFTVARNNSFWHWTMNVNRPDSTSGEGGGIAIACEELHTKPIYCHPILLEGVDAGTYSITYSLSCMIFNNDPTPFTLATFKKWFDDLVELTENRVRIMCSGGINKWKAAASTTASNIVIIVCSIDKTAYGNYTISGIGISNGQRLSFADSDWNNLFPSNITFIDGVNRIN